MLAPVVMVLSRHPWECAALQTMLQGLGYTVSLATDPFKAVEHRGGHPLAAVMLDSASPEDEGVKFLREIAKQGEPLPTIIISSSAAEPREVLQLMKPDSTDFVAEPLAGSELDGPLPAAAHQRTEQRRQGRSTLPTHILRGLDLWISPKMKRVRVMLDQVAKTDITALIRGDTGTGKDLVARAIHALSARTNGPFVKVNCAAMPRELLESELFGHEKGAFTGAHQRKPGKFEFANTGTIFLDEIGDLHPSLQAKLLHVLQDGQFSRVGGKVDVKVDVRVLAATNHNLESLVALGRFREDLFYRVNVVTIEVPPLRERREEIPGLLDYFVEEYRKQFRRPDFEIDAETRAALIRHAWPGNVRELENTVKRMIVLGDVQTALHELDQKERGKTAAPAPMAQISLKDISRQAALQAEREVIRRVLEGTRWNRLHAAKLLKISYRALLYKIKAAGLDDRPSDRAALRDTFLSSYREDQP